MEIFGQNADRVIEGYSEEFEADFMELMRRSHPRARVAAKNVYNEFIADKYHIHMNSTKWFTLTEFVKYLGKTGIPPTQVTMASLHLSRNMLTTLLLNHRQSALAGSSLHMHECGQVLIAGKCRVDETPKGWFISLLEADKLEEIEKGKRSKRDRAERDEEQRRCSCCLTSAMAGFLRQ